MDNYDRLSKTSAAIALGTATALAIGIDGWLDSKCLPPIARLGIVILAVGIGSVFLENRIEQVFGRFTSLRRLLLSDQYIEGVWSEVLSSQGEPIMYAIAHFEPDGYGLRYHGNNYSLNGRHLGSFNTTIVDRAWPTLRCVGTDAGNSTSFANATTYGEKKFSSYDGSVCHYEGFFVAFGDGSRCDIHAWKVTAKDDLRSLADASQHASTVVRLGSRYNASAQLAVDRSPSNPLSAPDCSMQPVTARH